MADTVTYENEVCGPVPPFNQENSTWDLTQVGPGTYWIPSGRGHCVHWDGRIALGTERGEC